MEEERSKETWVFRGTRVNQDNILVDCCRYIYVCKIKSFVKRHDTPEAIRPGAARPFHVSHLFLGMQNDCWDLSSRTGDDLDKVLILFCMRHPFHRSYLVCKRSCPECLHVHSTPLVPVFCIVNDTLGQYKT